MKRRSLLRNIVAAALAMILGFTVFFSGKIYTVQVYTAKAGSSNDSPSSPDDPPADNPDPAGSDEEIGTPGIDYIRDEDEEEDDYDYAKYIEALFENTTLEYIDEIEDPFLASVHLTTEVPYGAGQIAYIDCNFNSALMEFECTISTTETDEAVQFTEPAIVTDKGELTCTISDDETDYRIADYHDCNDFSKLVKEVYFDEEAGRTDPLSASSNLINANLTPRASARKISLKSLFGWLPPIVKIVVIVFVVVAETAEQIKARDNYRHNQSVETYFGKPNEYCHDQQYLTHYRFGFTTLDDVGCAPISVYNLLISLGRGQTLSEVVFKFEKWAIEFSVGFGYLGSNPADMYRFFRFEGIRYTRYLTALPFFMKAKSTSYTHFIMAIWYKPINKGAHTFYVKKEIDAITGAAEYYGYNYKGTNITPPYNDIMDVPEDSTFIAGYIIRE